MGFWRRKKAVAPRYKIGNPNKVKARSNAFRAEIEALASEARGERPKSAESITAAGELVRHGQATLLRRLVQPWQIRSFGYYDMLGEIKFAAQFYARALANLELWAGEINDDGEIVETTNQDVIDALNRIKDPGGVGRTELLSTYGRLMFLTGEALLFVSINPDTNVEQWEMLSTDELRLLDGNYTRFKAPVLPATLFKPAPDDSYAPVMIPDPDDPTGDPIYDESAVAYRLWRKHPRFSQLPDATMEGVLDLCEELVLLTQAVRARARSRLAGSGILFLDDRITTTPAEPTPDEDPLEDPFIEDLTDAMTSPITDEGTASAVVPLIARVRVPDNMKLSDLVYHLQIIDPTQLYPETGLRMECIKRIAIGLDMPPEILLGMQDSNHWSAWQVDEQVWKAHLQPIANGLVQDLTSAYLSPYLMKVKALKDWDKYLIQYDATAIINHPDRTQDALSLFGLNIIGKGAVRREAGFEDADAPTKAESAERIGIIVKDSSLAWYGFPAPRGGAVEAGPGEIVSDQPGATDIPDDADATGANVEKGPPPGEPDPEQDNIVGAAQVSMIEGAAQLALLRAREAAGAKLRSLSRRDDELAKVLDTCRSREAAAVLGRTQVRQLIGGAKEAELVAGAHDLIMDSLRVFNVTDSRVAEAICDTIEKHAVRTLYELKPSPLPPSFGEYVSRLLEVSMV